MTKNIITNVLLFLIINCVVLSTGNRFILHPAFFGQTPEGLTQKVCSAENMNDQKMDLFRQEFAKCHIDECLVQADDLPQVSEVNHAMFINMGCSQKYNNCKTTLIEHYRHQQSNDTDMTANGTVDNQSELRAKWKVKQECATAAFQKAFGA